MACAGNWYQARGASRTRHCALGDPTPDDALVQLQWLILFLTRDLCIELPIEMAILNQCLL